jgi:hypothetical protein
MAQERKNIMTYHFYAVNARNEDVFAGETRTKRGLLEAVKNAKESKLVNFIFAWADGRQYVWRLQGNRWQAWTFAL